MSEVITLNCGCECGSTLESEEAVAQHKYTYEHDIRLLGAAVIPG
jgi:hypothetical protein